VPETAAAIVMLIVKTYVVAGLAFALPFVARGVNAIDARAAGAGWGFRLAIVPGAIVFWPLLLGRWVARR
jgi:hypothetical protein